MVSTLIEHVCTLMKEAKYQHTLIFIMKNQDKKTVCPYFMNDKFLSMLRYLEGMFRDVILLMLESAVSKTECLCIKSWKKWEKRNNK